MTSSIRSAQLLRELLGQLDSDADPGAQGRKLMEDKMRAYLARQAVKKAMQRKASSTSSGASTPSANPGNGGVSEALRKKDREREARIASRRRIRGGALPVMSTRNAGPAETLLSAINQQDEAVIAYVLSLGASLLFIHHFVAVHYRSLCLTCPTLSRCSR